MKRYFLPAFLLFSAICFTTVYSVAQQHPNIGGYNVYYGHLHNHTSVSDGTGTPDQAYSYAKNTAGLDFFSLSDHSEMMDATEWSLIKNVANLYNEDDVFTTFYGFEWSSVFEGHVSVINTDDYCEYTSLTTNNFSGLLNWVNARNGIAFFNHPGWSWWAFQEFNKFTDSPSDKFVGMELWNDIDGFSKYYYNDGYYSNDGGKGYFDEALVRGWKIGAAGSDDNHVSTWGTRTSWRVAVLADNLTRTDIMDAFIARRFFSTLDKNLSLSLKINGAEMGSTVTGGTLNLQITAKDEDSGEGFSKVVLMKNGLVAETINLYPSLNNISITRTLTGVDKDYFYVKVTEADGDEAISSPVFIEGVANQAPLVSITSPENNYTFNLGEPVDIVASASDPDGGTITNVEFYQNGNYLGADNSSPYECNWAPVASGTYELTAKATDNLGASTFSLPVTITVSVVEPPVNFTVESRVSQGSDDAEQYTKGTVILDDNVLNIVYESKTTGNQTIGLRFTNIDIPQGATITNAFIEFTAASSSSGGSSLTIKGEATDNATTFTTKSKNLSSRKKTAASAAWTPDKWTLGDIVHSVDIKAVVQEIVNRSGWNSGNAMAILITGTGTRTAESYEGSKTEAPLIHIEYTTTKSGFIAEQTADQTQENLTPEAEIMIYPNPVNDVLTIKTSGKTEVKTVLIYSVTGSLVKETVVNQSLAEIQVDCSQLISGVYVLRLNMEKGNHTMQFIKQ